MQRDAAETVAIKALSWLVGHDDLLPVFLGATGAALADVRERAADPEFLAAVLDFVMMDDAWLIAFCEGADLDCSAPMQARQSLPGGALPNWT